MLDFQLYALTKQLIEMEKELLLLELDIARDKEAVPKNPELAVLSLLYLQRDEIKAKILKYNIEQTRKLYHLRKSELEGSKVSG